jgi:predicted nucleic acid-binding protein
MFDTSIFNFIYEHGLYSYVESFFTKNKDISVYICDTQVLEIRSIRDTLKRDKIEKMIQNILVKTVICSLGYVGSNKSYNRLAEVGFEVGRVKVADMNGSKPQEIEELKHDKTDSTILNTAITEEMDYLVTRDKKMKTLLPKRLKEVMIYDKKYSELKIELIKDEKDLIIFLNRLS